MKKFISILSVLLAVFLIVGCKQGLSKAEVEQMIKDSQKNGGGGGGGGGGAGGNSSISDILETAVTEVSGKVWTVTRNTVDAGDKGGKKEAGFDHEITFDKESFTFSISMKDGGILSKDLTVNQDYMDLVNTGVAELKDGKLVFKNRMYIKRVYLPKLSKWLSLNGDEYDNSGVLPDHSEDPFNKYFKDGYHQGYPNLVLDVELEVQGTGSGRFRNVDNLATVDKLRLVIKDGKLTLVNVKEKPEQAAALDKSYLHKLMYNYYRDSGAVFDCKDWPPFKEDMGKYTTDVSAVQGALNALKAEMRNTSKRDLPTEPVKWGYDVTGAFTEAADVDLVFDANKIVAVIKKMVPNPAYAPELPEDPVTNPKEIEGIDKLAPLFTIAQPDPANKEKANPLWTSHDELLTASLDHKPHMGGQNTFMVKDFDAVKNATVVWKVLYGTNTASGEDDSTPATITIKREVKDEGTFEDATDIATKKYRSNDTESGFDANDPTHYDDPLRWTEKAHAGKVKKYKVTYTMSIKFDNINDSYFSKNNDFKDKALSSNEFEVKYANVPGTADADFDWVYTLEPYKVMEKYEKKDKWLTFSEVELYGIVSKKKDNGEVEPVTDLVKYPDGEKLTNAYLKRTVTGDTVLNNQTHFFVSSVIPNTNGKYISRITKIKIIPKMENVHFNVTSEGGLTVGGTWDARINKDDATSIDVSLSDGYKEFTIPAGELEVTRLNGFDHFKDSRLIITLSGLDKHSVAHKEGECHDSSVDKKYNWNGYSFVIHFGK
ncbi:hypothetical protein DWB79_07315 [Treponema medium]|uniref:Lipoprotein n=2 Tax=Treponema medium TaxID=58231 RepID=A0AA87NQL0_TREMD|nr:hypothetical protein [Treponema medium]EPF28547.1 hypothetical protein HMPREF9195_01444 [Treponema medium ATCC 700293]QSH97558.1 hypothetical protein DWB79_07315 [Treponema medium]